MPDPLYKTAAGTLIRYCNTGHVVLYETLCGVCSHCRRTKFVAKKHRRPDSYALLQWLLSSLLDASSLLLDQQSTLAACQH